MITSQAINNDKLRRFCEFRIENTRFWAPTESVVLLLYSLCSRFY